MLSRRLIIFYLFILFTGLFAQRNGLNDGEEDDDDGNKPNNAVNPPLNNIRNKVRNQDGDSNTRSQVGNQLPSNSGQLRSGPSRQTVPSTQLAGSEECQTDIQKYCGKGSTQLLSNLKVLQCVDDLDNAVNLIRPECQNRIYKFKLNMTRDPRFDDAALNQCSKDIKLFDDCSPLTNTRGSGRLIICLYENLKNITQPSCRYFINQLQAVIFTDWRLIENFGKSCETDITKLECGRLDDENEKLPHEQGAVISCLSQKFGELNGACRKEIFRLAEMQSDDYHLDRALYYACREDRERFCQQVQSGNGRVYRCLYEQKFNNMMSQACRREVHRRQSLVVANVQSDVPLVRACESEMKEHRCLVQIDDTDKRSSLIKLLLCLEERLKKGSHIQDECRREMLVHRRMLMSDYALSPEIVKDCKVEMVRYCSTLYTQGASGTIDARGGRMIHCLLNAARKEKQFSSECLSTVSSLMRAVDPGNDIRADPLLETTCRPVIDTLCPRIKPGDSNVVMCLLDNLKNSKMTEDCEDRLMEVAYFMARDWRLTPRLMRTCQKHLVDFCALPNDWSMSKEMNDIQVGMYLGCLYQQRQKLNSECRTELKRLMHIRTQSIGLMPEIEHNCLTDLATCKNPEIKGEEMKCLQQKYDKLEDQCKAVIRNFTQMTMSDPTLDFLLMKACEPMIQMYCPSIDGGKENDLIRCLIRHKNEQKMDFRCKAGIEHHQITSMKDEAFLSQSFRKQCSREVNEHCPGKKTKASVIQCLADLMLNDVLKKQNAITEDCRDELKFELLQRSESIDFDPTLAKACEKDIRALCSDRTPGNAEILDCLKDKRGMVSAKCYAKLKRREKLDVILPENDYSLMSKCAVIIQKSCANERKQNILACLRRNFNSDAMPITCRKILNHRLMILNSNAKFNKGLIENCKPDIEKYCQSEVVEDDKESGDEDDKDKDNQDDQNPGADGGNDLTDREMGGRVIECLRKKYVDTHFTLQSQCVTELVDVIQTSKLDVKLDVRLYRSCKSYLTDKCTGIEPEDCLKLLYQKGEIRDDDCREQIKRIIREGQADIHVDRALAFACQADITKYCIDIPIGSGKQLQCLISMGKSVTPQCANMLLKRKELWDSVSSVEGVGEVVEQIKKSNNSVYLISVILLILFVMFMAGCLCRPYVRYNRVRKYK